MKRIVKLTLLIAGTLLLICSCVYTSTQSGGDVTTVSSAWYYRDYQEYEKLFSLFNSYGGSVCMGISGPSSNKDKAIEIATERCVQYLAFYRGLAMQVDFGSVVDSNRTNASIEYNVNGGTADSKVIEAAKEFEIVDVQWLGGRIGAVVFARLPEMKKIKSVNNVLGGDIPKINGRYVAVATSEVQYSDFADAIEAATFRVAQALIDIHEGTVNVSNNIVNTTQDKYRGDSFSISGNRLEGFAVLAYEYNMEDNKVYALAVCNK